MVEDPTGRFGPKPEPPVELELDRDRAPPPPAFQASTVQQSFYPDLDPRRTNRARRTRRLALFLTLLVVAFGVALFGKAYLDERSAAEIAAEAAKKARQEAELLKDLAAPKNAPECWVGNSGYLFVYEEKGTSVVKDRIEDVPLKKRRKARCIPAQ